MYSQPKDQKFNNFTKLSKCLSILVLFLLKDQNIYICMKAILKILAKTDKFFSGKNPQ